MQVINIERKFKYNSVTLPDPNPDLSPEQIREFYATQYPELNNAVVEGPVTKNEVATWTFTRAAGAKGVGAESAFSAQEIVRAAAARPSDSRGDALALAARAGKHMAVAACIASVALERRGGHTATCMPSSAFGIWG
jgi:PRTRC genetic system protein C